MLMMEAFMNNSCRFLSATLLLAVLHLAAQPKEETNRFTLLNHDGTVLIVRSAHGKYGSVNELPDDVRRIISSAHAAAKPSENLPVPAASGTIFTVSNAGDAEDADLDDNIYTPATLRSAIQNANKLGGSHSIVFSSGITVIKPGSPLPSVNVPITINGAVAAGKVVLDGSLTFNSSGLVLGKTSTVMNMVFQHWNGVGLGLGFTAVNSIIQRCSFIGNGTGLNINGSFTTVGGINPADGNVAGNNTQDGIGVVFANDCIIQDNFSGTMDGITASPNTYSGVYVNGERTKVLDNVLSGNNDTGVDIGEFSKYTVIKNNLVGLDVYGFGKLSNMNDGINTFGDNDSIVGNFICGNGYGITVLGQSSNAYIASNAVGVTILYDTLIGNRYGGMQILGSGVIITNNVVVGNTNAGITLTGAGGTIVRSNNIGTDPNGLKDWGNSGPGINIVSSNNIIGGPATGDINIISGNGGSGISMYGGIIFSFPGPSGPNYVRGNLIQNNYIGTNSNGTGAIPNSTGISMQGYVDSNFVRSNLISGNQHHGIWMYQANGGPTRNTFTNNYIGTTISGQAPLPNYDRGIYLQFGSNNIIGGENPNTWNLISGNNGPGVWIHGGSSNTFRNNGIGVTVDGKNPLPNFGDGVRISAASSNNVIHTNIIAGNSGNGISIQSESGKVPDGNVVIGNIIGTENNISTAMANFGDGMVIVNGSKTRVGGIGDSANYISGHLNRHGIAVYGDTSRGTIIRGNAIGINGDGTAPLPNGRGILLSGVKHAVIGGIEPLSGNVISGNTDEGIYLFVSDSNSLYRNTIGLNGAETAMLPNGFCGILVDSSHNNIIGSPLNLTGNTVSGNGYAGIAFIRSSSQNTVAGNFIGTDYTKTKQFGNKEDGIQIYNGSHRNIIGTPGGGNTIWYNGYSGVIVADSNRNRISENSIYSNGTLGIDLYSGVWGISPNDEHDADVGGNDLQNYPTLFFADGPFPARIAGTMESKPDETYTIEFFSSHAADSTGFGEGKTFLGSHTLGTDSTGFAFFNILLPASVSTGYYVTATATDAEGNTSEFSRAVQVISSGLYSDIAVTVRASADTVRRGDTVAFLITVQNNGPDSATHVTVRDTLPSTMSHVRDTTTKGTVTYSSGIVTASIGALAAGEKAVVMITAVADSFGLFINKAYGAAQQSDFDLTNNVGADTIVSPLLVTVRAEIGHPESYQLFQNFPNPFNPSTEIRYQIPEAGFVSLKVYDILGKEVARLVNERKEAGFYSVRFSSVENGLQLSSGVYFYLLKAGSFVDVKKFLLMK